MDTPYHTTLFGLRETLHRYGVAVLPSIVTVEECCATILSIWDGIELLSQSWSTPINRNNPDTWNVSSLNALHGMLIQHHQIAHLQAAWNVRQHPKVIDAFEALWGTRDLLCSFDGMSISFPPEITGKGWARKGGEWLHCDQSFAYPDNHSGLLVSGEGYSCVQSWFSPVEVREGDATLAFLEGSHLYHRRFGYERNITEKDDWYKLSDEEIQVYLSYYQCPLRKITCPAGSLVLWDSRTIHYGAQPEKSRNQQNFRYCIYVCMMPKSFATEKQLQKKRQAYIDKRVTRHHPVNVTLFPKGPRIYSKDQVREPMMEIPYPCLTDIGKGLAGF